MISSRLAFQCNKCHHLCNQRLLPLGKQKSTMTQILTTDGFKKEVLDYTTQSEWNYQGTLPAIIDFYADWCGPCKMVAPILEELAKEYEGRLIIYKVDTEKEQELSAAFGIRSIPTFLFIPMEGKPMMQPGVLSKSMFKQVIDEQLLGTPISVKE
jgi:thioredoxin 1